MILLLAAIRALGHHVRITRISNTLTLTFPIRWLINTQHGLHERLYLTDLQLLKLGSINHLNLRVEPEEITKRNSVCSCR